MGTSGRRLVEKAGSQVSKAPKEGCLKVQGGFPKTGRPAPLSLSQGPVNGTRLTVQEALGELEKLSKETTCGRCRQWVARVKAQLASARSREEVGKGLRNTQLVKLLAWKGDEFLKLAHQLEL